MSNVECNVVRDLMPLCIDGAASEESRKVVVEHVWKCERCAEVYKEMQGKMLPSQQDDTNYLDAAARRLHRKRKNRKRILIAVTCLLTAIVVLVAMWGYDYATNRSIFHVALDEYDAYLTRTREDGRIILNIDMKDKKLCYSYGGYGVAEDDGRVYRMSVNTTLIREYYAEPQHLYTDVQDWWYWIDGAIYAADPATTKPIASIRMYCGDDEKIIYQYGDDIPFCSKELEAYYDAWDAYHDYDISANRRRFDFDEKREELRQKAVELSKLVPEWQ